MAIMAVTRTEIAATEKLIRPHVRRTPVVVEGNLVFKLELLQHSGSFKARGAFANLLTREVPVGVVAASGGNHGAAVAYAAMKLEKGAHFRSNDLCKAKIERIRAYGADLSSRGALRRCARRPRNGPPRAARCRSTLTTRNGAARSGDGRPPEEKLLDTLLGAVGGGA
jgi:threonine dehydratase